MKKLVALIGALVALVGIMTACVPNPPGSSFRQMWQDDDVLWDHDGAAGWSGSNGVSTFAATSKPAACITDQSSRQNNWALANALVWRSTANSASRLYALDAIDDVIGKHNNTSCGGSGRALEIGRNVGAYVIAADMINLPSYNSSINSQFVTWLGQVESYSYPGSPDADGNGTTTLRDCFRHRPDNWGVHCAFTQTAIDIYQGDSNGWNDVFQTFYRYAGDRSVPRWDNISTSSDFDYDDGQKWSTSSTCKNANPGTSDCRAINLPGTIPGTQLNGDGYIIRDADRAGDPNTSGTCPVYDGHWAGGWSGTMILATLLERLWDNDMVSGTYNDTAPKDMVFGAVLRASQGLQRVDNCNSSAISGDDEYARWLVDDMYPSANFPTVSNNDVGKVMAFAEYTHGG